MEGRVGGWSMLGRDKGLHQTRAAGNLGSAALLLRLLPADAAKTIFLGLILQLPPFPSWLSLAHGFVRKLAKSCSLSRKTAGMREVKEISNNLCFSTSLFRAAGSNLCPPLPGARPDLAGSAGGSLAGARGRKKERRGAFQRKANRNRENPEFCSRCHK